MLNEPTTPTTMPSVVEEEVQVIVKFPLRYPILVGRPEMSQILLVKGSRTKVIETIKDLHFQQTQYLLTKETNDEV